MTTPEDQPPERLLSRATDALSDSFCLLPFPEELLDDWERQLISSARLSLGRILAQGVRRLDLREEDLLAMSPEEQQSIVLAELRIELPLSGIVEIAVEIFEGYVDPYPL